MSIRILFFICIIISSTYGLSYAQSSLKFVLANSMRLRVAFPADGDTVDFDRVRYAGAVIPGSQVRVQDKKTEVFPSGAFVGLVELSEGFNSIVFEVQDSLGVLKDTLLIYRPPVQRPLPAMPTDVDVNGIFPSQDVYISSGDRLEVEFRGSPEGQATFSIDKLAKNIRMIESLDAQGRPTGQYQGYVMISEVENYRPKEVVFRLRGKDNKKIKFHSKGMVHVLSSQIPFLATTIDSVNLVQTEPDGEIWMELPGGITLEVVARQNGVDKIRLAENVVGFIESSSLRALPFGLPLPESSIGSISTLEDKDWVKFRINVSERVPFYIEQILDPAALEVTFYRARLAPQWIMYPRDDETIQAIRWRQESSEEFVLRIELNQTQQWGFSGRYVGKQFWLNIRKSPAFINQPDSLFKNLIITIDPGHGGEFEGAVSATGMYEKDVNLRYAKLVADSLRVLGASVAMTRTQDSTLSLPERIQIARKANSHIFMSLHNNSIGAATDPMRPRGTSTYYTVPQSQEIAKHVYHRMLELGLQPFGRISSTYYVTRQTDLLSFIVEAAFVTHPEDEMLLLDSEFLTRLAGAIVAGLQDFVFSQVPSHVGTEIGQP